MAYTPTSTTPQVVQDSEGYSSVDYDAADRYNKKTNENNYKLWLQSLKDEQSLKLLGVGLTAQAYKEAGFSPAASVGQNPDLQGFDSFSKATPRDVDLSDRASQAAAVQAQQQMANSQMMLQGSQARLLEDQAEGQRIKNEMDQNELDDYERRRDKEFAKMDAEEAVQQSIARLNNVKSEVEDLNRQLKSGELQYQPRLYDRIFKKYDEEINNIKSNTNLNEETKNLRIEEINKARQETKESQSREALNYAEKRFKEEATKLTTVQVKEAKEALKKLENENLDYLKDKPIREAERELDRILAEYRLSPAVSSLLKENIFLAASTENKILRDGSFYNRLNLFLKTLDNLR